MATNTPTVGIDISGVQDGVPPGDWLFVVVKSTEGLSVVNPRLDAQWAAAAAYPRRGLYHYARPNLSSGKAQANVFADDALKRGFRPGHDMWQLDCEGGLNETVPTGKWGPFVDDFYAAAKARLGALGFVYVGRYFQLTALSKARLTYPWWIPDYGNNDGTVHPTKMVSTPTAGVPVIHQFSSHGNLDRNVICDLARWAIMTGASAAPDGASAIGDDDDMQLFVDDMNPGLDANHPRVACLQKDGSFIMGNGARFAEKASVAWNHLQVVQSDMVRGGTFAGGAPILASNGKCIGVRYAAIDSTGAWHPYVYHFAAGA